MDKRSVVRNSDALLEDQNQELAQFVNNILKDMQTRFNTMTDAVINRIDDMGDRIDELEKRYVLNILTRLLFVVLMKYCHPVATKVSRTNRVNLLQVS